MTGFICSASIYEYEGWIFEYGYNVWPLTKALEPRQKAGEKFWEMIGRWEKLTDKEQAAFKIGGGCERF